DELVPRTGDDNSPPVDNIWGDTARDIHTWGVIGKYLTGSYDPNNYPGTYKYASLENTSKCSTRFTPQTDKICYRIPLAKGPLPCCRTINAPGTIPVLQSLTQHE